jgi:hypothetical protein
MLAERKRFTIDITVKLGRYENLRLEVEREIASGYGAWDLVAFLDETLARLGGGDLETAQRIDRYHRCILMLTTGSPGSYVAEYAPRPASPEVARPEVQFHFKPLEKTPLDIQGQGQVGTSKCEKSGVRITPSEEKVCQFFTRTRLCRKCLKHTQ